MWASFKERIDSAVLGSLWTLYRGNKVLQQKMDNCCVDQFKDDSRIKCSGDDLKTMLTISIQSLERIENKAMGTLLGVAVAIAVFGATSGLLGSDGPFAGKCYAAQIVAATLLIVAMAYLFASGLLALGAYRIGQVFRPELVDHASVTDQTHEQEWSRSRPHVGRVDRCGHRSTISAHWCLTISCSGWSATRLAAEPERSAPEASLVFFRLIRTMYI